MDTLYFEQARVFKALCDENRLRILEVLRGGEQCACRLIEALGIVQSGLSYHMRILLESGIVESRQEGKWIYYRISPVGRENAILLLEELTAAVDNADPGCI